MTSAARTQPFQIGISADFLDERERLFSRILDLSLLDGVPGIDYEF